MRLTTLVGLIASVAIACPYIAHAQGQSFSRDSAGIRITTSSAKNVMLPPREIARIGTAEGDPKYELYRVTSIAIDVDGSYYVAMDSEVRVYDGRGKYLRTIGRKGKGPGEFNMAPLVWFAGDTLVAIDRNLMRSTAFTRDGKPLKTFNAFAHPGAVTRPIARSDAGWIARDENSGTDADEQTMAKTLASIKLAPGQIGEFPPTLLRRFYPVTDSFGPVVFRVPEQKLVGTPASRDNPYGLRARTFDDERAYAIDKRGFAYIKIPGTYRIDIFDKVGKPVGSLRREFTPIPLTMKDFDGLLDAMVDNVMRSVTLGPGTKEQDVRRRERQTFAAQIEDQKKTPLPPYRFPVARLLVSPNGMLWAERADYMKPAEREALHQGPNRLATRWDIFDPGSRYIATTDLPVGFIAHTVTDNGRIVGVYKDTDNVEYVVTFQVLPPRS